MTFQIPTNLKSEEAELRDSLATWIQEYVDVDGALDDLAQEFAEPPYAGEEYGAESLREALEWLKGGHTKGKSAVELEEMAGRLTPGGAHTDGGLIMAAVGHIMFPDPLLVTATIREAWRGGKAGFQFLPDPAETDPEEYQEEAWDLYEMLRGGEFENVALQDILTNTYDPDLAFYEALPDRLTVYRGAAGISPELCAAGLCWTTKRRTAEWFAQRIARGREPVLVSSRVWKNRAALAFAAEHELVIQPFKHRVLKCRPVPKMTPPSWEPGMEPCQTT